ncbi:MAG TPA: ParA family protein [Chloroflexia bacterium]|nr:ParA family protein [Chloroflexia bacterium]
MPKTKELSGFEALVTAAKKYRAKVKTLGRGAVVVVANEKGGIGKSTITALMGSALAEVGLRVLVIDIDPQSSVTQMILPNLEKLPQPAIGDLLTTDFDSDEAIFPQDIIIEVTPGSVYNNGAAGKLYLLPSNPHLGKLNNFLATNINGRQLLRFLLKELDLDGRTLASSYDVIVIDTPSQLDSVFAESALIAGDVVVMPATPRPVDQWAIAQTIQKIKEASKVANRGLEIVAAVVNMYDPRSGLVESEGLDAVKAVLGDRVVDPPIRSLKTIANSPAKSLSLLTAGQVQKPADDFRQTAAEVLDRIVNKLDKGFGKSVSRGNTDGK